MTATIATEIPMGTIVRLRGRNGCLLDPDAGGFSEHITSDGDLGLYFRPHRIPRWHLVAVAFEGRTLYVPVHAGLFEVV
jgi:hypothetical protein